MKDKKYGYGYYFRCIQTQIEKQLNEAFKEFGLTKSQEDILRFLRFTSLDMVTQKDIETFFHISNPTVTGLLNRLEQKGFIERSPHPYDKRSHIIQLTEQSDLMHQKIQKTILSLEKQMTDGLNESQKKDLFILLSKVKENLIKEEKTHDQNTHGTNQRV